MYEARSGEEEDEMRTYSVREIVACDCETFVWDYAGQVPWHAEVEAEGLFNLTIMLYSAKYS